MKLVVGQRVFLDDTTRGKLDPRWTGPWELLVQRTSYTGTIDGLNKVCGACE